MSVAVTVIGRVLTKPLESVMRTVKTLVSVVSKSMLA